MSLGEWAKAADDYVALIERNPEDPLTWLRVTILFALADRPADYAKYCRRMLERFGGSDDATDAEMTVKACLLVSGVFDLEALPLETLNDALDDGPAPSWFYGFGYCSRALAAYRAGDATEGVIWVRRCQQNWVYGYSPAFEADVHVILVLAQRQLGQTDDAHKSLARASALIEKYLPRLATDEVGDAWSDWLPLSNPPPPLRNVNQRVNRPE